MGNIAFAIVAILVCISVLLFPAMLVWVIWFGPSPFLGKLCLSNLIVFWVLFFIGSVLSEAG